jgi:hypothetical protein
MAGKPANRIVGWEKARMKKAPGYRGLFDYDRF